MSNKTKQLFVLSSAAAVLAVGALTYIFYKIEAQSLLLEEQISILNESNTKESAYLRLSRLAQETESKRTLLAASFFKDEGDSIVFLGEVEALAKEIGLSLKTEDLDKIVSEDNKQEFIKMTFVYTGKKETVFDFTKLMEVIPYHAVVDSLSLSKMPDANWEGNLTILITLNPV